MCADGVDLASARSPAREGQAPPRPHMLQPSVFHHFSLQDARLVIPSAPRLPAEYRQPRFEGNDYRPEGAEIAGVSSADTKTLRSMPAAMMTLLAALARSREAVNDRKLRRALSQTVNRTKKC
jgi:hypothetical protein